MKYSDGSPAKLGDIVMVPVHVGPRDGRIVMLGDTFEHLDLDPDFVAWVKKEKLIDSTGVAVQWIGDNPLAHNDPRHAPFGDIMFTSLDEDIARKENT